MADYTSEEIQEAVEKVVRSAIRRPYGSLGNRDVQVTFNDLQDAASGVFILQPNAPYYTVFLGTERLADLLEGEQEALVSLIEAIENTNRRVTDINSLTPLNNARAALQALESAAAGRTRSFQTIEDVPAFKRYNDNIQRFLDESSKNSRSKGAIVPTPQESRAALAGLVRTVTEQHDVILARTAYLSVAIADYDSLNLPSLLAQGVMARAREVLSDRIDELEALSPSQRLGKIREVTLDLLAGRSAVQGLGSLRQTTLFAQLEGTGAAFADVDHPASPAALAAEIGPYPIFVGETELDFTVDGSFTFAVPVPGSFVAFVDSTIQEPYDIDGTNDVLLLDIIESSGTTSRTIPLTTGGSVSAATVVADINAVLDLAPDPFVAEEVFAVFKFRGLADVVSTSPTTVDFTLPAPGTWEGVGIQEADLIEVLESASAQFGNIYSVDAGFAGGATVSCTFVSGPGHIHPSSELLQEVQLGQGRTVRIRVRDTFELASLDGRIGLLFPQTPGNTALQTSLTGGPPFTPPSLGFRLGGRIESRSTSADQVAQDVPRSFFAQTSGQPRLDAEVELVPLFSGNGRTDPDDPSKLILYKFRGRGDTTGGGPVGVVFDVSGADELISLGDILVIRETSILADQNVKGVVTAVTSSSITATMDAAISAASDVLVEVGPDLTLANEYLDLRVTESASQDGDYTMQARGQVLPFEFVLENAVPLNRDLGGQPVFFTLTVGNKRVVFSSTDTTLATKIRVFDSGSGITAADKFFASLPAEAVGSTPYFQIPSDPKSLTIGDSLELYEAAYNVVSRAFNLEALELSQLLLTISPEIETDFGSINMSLSSPIPFARIRLQQKNNYDVLEADLVEWLSLDANKTAWTKELNRLINPLIVNTNPTAAQVNAAKLHVQARLAILTIAGATSTSQPVNESLEAILAAYQVDPVDAVDTLVDTFLARGSDRGVDILLQGRFSDFFGLSLEGMSYGGAFRENLRLVSRQDLPVRKVSRGQRLDREMTVGEWTDPDFEFDQSDVDGVDDVEIPGEFAEIVPRGQ